MSTQGNARRYDALVAGGLLDASPEPAFDRLTRLARRLLGVPAAAVSFFDVDRQIIKSQEGLPEAMAYRRELSIAESLCYRVVEANAVFIVEDAASDFALTDGTAADAFGIRAYLGIPLHAPDGAVVGVFCAIDGAPRAWSAQDVETLQDLAAIAASEVRLRFEMAAQTRTMERLRRVEARLRLALSAGGLGHWRLRLDVLDISLSSDCAAILGLPPGAMPDPTALLRGLHPDDAEAVRRDFLAARAGDKPFARTFRFCRPDGVQRWLLVQGHVDNHDAKRMIGVLADVTARHEADEVRERLATIVQRAPFLVASGDDERRLVYINPAGRRLLGLPANDDGATLTGDDIIPPKELKRLRTEALPAALATGSWHGESVLRHRDGSLIPVLQIIIAHEQGPGGRAYFSSIAQDISAQKREAAQRELLVRELNHRVKNMLAFIQAIARLSTRGTTDVAAYSEALLGRVAALAVAQDLLISQESAGLAQLIDRTLSPHRVTNEDRFAVDVRDDLPLSPQAAQNIALILHELATNALKYGALANPRGRVNVDARRAGADDASKGAAGTLEIVWDEQAERPVLAPTRTGFGTTLLDRVVRVQHGGELAIDWRPKGVLCRLSLPLAGILAGG